MLTQSERERLLKILTTSLKYITEKSVKSRVRSSILQVAETASAHMKENLFQLLEGSFFGCGSGTM